MKKNDYINAVLEQVRCKSAHEPLKRELEAHIDDQAEAFISVGFPESEAEEEAVKTMGNAVETGIQLDAEHRPRCPWSAIIIALLLMLAGAAARLFVGEYFDFFVETNRYEVLCIPLSLTVMAIFYFMDYTVFTKFPKITYIFFIGILAAVTLLLRYDEDRNAAGRAFFFGTVLLVPLTCGFVWSMRRKGFGGFVLTCILMVVPAAFTALYIPCLSAAVLIGLSVLAIMTFAVKNDFFHVKKISAYLFMYIPAGLAVISLLAFKIFLPAFFRDNYGRELRFGFTTSYESYYADIIFKGTRLFGESRTPFYELSFPKSDHLITAIIIRSGWAAGIAMSLLILSLPVIVLIKSIKIKNIFGRMTAFSIGIVFLFETVSFIMANFGFTASIASIIAPPFMTANLMNAITSSALLGIFMSVYRTKDIFPEQKIKTVPLSHL